VTRPVAGNCACLYAERSSTPDDPAAESVPHTVDVRKPRNLPPPDAPVNLRPQPIRPVSGSSRPRGATARGFFFFRLTKTVDTFLVPLCAARAVDVSPTDRRMNAFFAEPVVGRAERSHARAVGSRALRSRTGPVRRSAIFTLVFPRVRVFVRSPSAPVPPLSFARLFRPIVEKRPASAPAPAEIARRPHRATAVEVPRYLTYLESVSAPFARNPAGALRCALRTLLLIGWAGPGNRCRCGIEKARPLPVRTPWLLASVPRSWFARSPQLARLRE